LTKHVLPTLSRPVHGIDSPSSRSASASILATGANGRHTGGGGGGGGGGSGDAGAAPHVFLCSFQSACWHSRPQ